jgi:hypothetical protein
MVHGTEVERVARRLLPGPLERPACAATPAAAAAARALGA